MAGDQDVCIRLFVGAQSEGDWLWGNMYLDDVAVFDYFLDLSSISG
jgi:hypothetical protein